MLALLFRNGFFSRFTQSISRNARRRKRSQEAPLRRAFDGVVAEAMEGRRLLSSESFSGGVWTINADNTTEVIIVYRQINVSSVDKTFVRINTAPLTIFERLTSDITSKIVVHANNGDDEVMVETQAEVDSGFRAGDNEINLGSHGVNKPLEINGGFGTDTVWGGDGADTLNGDSGTDELLGRGGADALESLSVAGGDFAWGGEGNDTIGFAADSDTGGDTYDGEGGNDTIYGGAGGDSLWAGPGTDSLFGNAGNDFFHSQGDSIDYLDGGDGSDDATDRDIGTDAISNMEFT